MKTRELLHQLGLSQQQSHARVLIYQYGPKPASTIAQMMKIERTNCYKMLQVLSDRGLIQSLVSAGVKRFFVHDKYVLQQKIAIKSREVHDMEMSLSIVEQELQQLDEQRVVGLPQMRFFEGVSGVEQFFLQIGQYVTAQRFQSIKIFASNTLDSQTSPHQQCQSLMHGFFDFLATHTISVDATTGIGIELMQQLVHTQSPDDMKKLPTGNAAVQIYVVGEMVSVVLYAHAPYAWTIRSRPFADVMHFMLNQLSRVEG